MIPRFVNKVKPAHKTKGKNPSNSNHALPKIFPHTSQVDGGAAEAGAVMRRFITIELGNPTEQDLSDVSVVHKGAYATQVIGKLLTKLCADVLLERTLRQQQDQA